MLVDGEIASLVYVCVYCMCASLSLDRQGQGGRELRNYYVIAGSGNYVIMTQFPPWPFGLWLETSTSVEKPNRNYSLHFLLYLYSAAAS